MKVYLNVVESKKSPAHSVYRDLMSNPPLEYVNRDFPKISQKAQKSLSFLSKLLNLIKLPNLWQVKESCDLVHSAGYLITNHKPWVIDMEMNAALTGFNANRLYSPLCKSIIKRYLTSKYCKKILPWSEAAAKSITNYLPDKRIAEKIEVVYPTIIPPVIPKVKKENGKVNLLFVGRYFLAKGGKETLKVVDQLSQKYDLHLTISSGDVPEELIKKYSKNKNITFTTLSREELYQTYFPQADIFVLPTHYDTYGIVFLEAQAFGIPIVSSRTFAVPEIVEDGKTGLLTCAPKVSWFDSNYQLTYKGKHEENWKKFNRDLSEIEDKELEQELYSHLETLIKDKELRKKMGEAGRKAVAEKFSVEKRNEQLRRIYEESTNISKGKISHCEL